MNAREDELRSALAAAHLPRSEAILEHLQRAADSELERISGLAPDCLLSLCVPLPAGLLRSLPGGDTRWFMPGGAGAFGADGEAVCYAGDQLPRFESDRRQWRLLGSQQALPLALFTLPPATLSALPKVWIPEVLIRLDGGVTCLVLSARRGSRPARRLVARWMATLRRLLSQAPASKKAGERRILERQVSPAPAQWRERVEAARKAIAAGQLAKVVLARRLEALLAAPVDPLALGDRLVRLYPECHVLSLPYGAGRVVAATPERLLSRRGSELLSCALAGTAVRHGRATEDAQAQKVLLASPKERHEHALVVEAIRERMRALCSEVSHAPEPGVFQLRFVQHLQTRLRGCLREGVGLLEAASHLHPTPAVLGLPRDAARGWLETIGEQRDGLYSGVAGWIDQAGDGEAVVVLRSVYLEQERAVLWAGAGILAESDPDAELAETGLKLRTMLEVLEGAP